MFKENVKYKFKNAQSMTAFKNRCDVNIEIASKIRELGNGVFTVKKSTAVYDEFYLYCNNVIVCLTRGRAILQKREFKYFSEIEDVKVPALEESINVDNTCEAVKKAAGVVKGMIKATGVKFTQVEYLKAVQYFVETK